MLSVAADFKRVKSIIIKQIFLVNTNRWDPILNYPGCMGVALRLRLYLNEYLSDLHVFCIRF